MGVGILIGVVMAGGKATRFQRKVEKGILEVGGRTLLERATDALEVPGIDRVVIATTASTFRTECLARDLDLEVFRTKGAGYHNDVVELIDSFDRFISVNVDVPFVAKEHISKLVTIEQRDSIAGVVPCRLTLRPPDKDSLIVGTNGEEMIWTGLNFVTINPETDFLVFEDPLLTLNINNEADLEFARKLASERGI